MLGFRASVADELRWLRPKLRWLRPNMHVGPSQADGATPRNRDRSSSQNDKERRGGYMEGGFYPGWPDANVPSKERMAPRLVRKGPRNATCNAAIA